ncbi:MAG: hypothetical protein ABR922_14705 [Streptosporangiaceae bacterium]|jgi:hypothetical protein
MANNEEPEPEEMGTWVNQRQDEPLPASHDDDRGQSAVVRNEQHAEKHAAGGPGGPPEQSSPGTQPAQPSEYAPGDTGPGQAVRDMMPSGPDPQGDVPDAPAVQVATVEGVHGGYVTTEGTVGESQADKDARDEENDASPPGPVRLVSNAVPGKPDGEVDTRP